VSIKNTVLKISVFTVLLSTFGLSSVSANEYHDANNACNGRYDVNTSEYYACWDIVFARSKKARDERAGEMRRQAELSDKLYDQYYNSPPSHGNNHPNNNYNYNNSNSNYQYDSVIRGGNGGGNTNPPCVIISGEKYCK
jgi:hypothetical protein